MTHAGSSGSSVLATMEKCKDLLMPGGAGMLQKHVRGQKTHGDEEGVQKEGGQRRQGSH